MSNGLSLTIVFHFLLSLVETSIFWHVAVSDWWSCEYNIHIYNYIPWEESSNICVWIRIILGLL